MQKMKQNTFVIFFMFIGASSCFFACDESDSVQVYFDKLLKEYEGKSRLVDNATVQQNNSYERVDTGLGYERKVRLYGVIDRMISEECGTHSLCSSDPIAHT